MNHTLRLRKPLGHATLDLDVRVTREFKIRMWIGVRLIRLAAWVMGGKSRFTYSKDKQEAS